MKNIKVKAAIRLILIFQFIFTTLFIFRTLADLLQLPLAFLPWYVFEVVEIFSSVGMLIGVVSSYLVIRLVDQRSALVEARVNAAAGEFHAFLESQFQNWKLTASEKAVAMLVIKGFSNVEIARMRGTSESTVKSQLSAIFRKSGLATRQQLVSHVVEDVIERLATDP